MKKMFGRALPIALIMAFAVCMPGCTAEPDAHIGANAPTTQTSAAPSAMPEQMLEQAEEKTPEPTRQPDVEAVKDGPVEKTGEIIELRKGEDGQYRITFQEQKWERVPLADDEEDSGEIDSLVDVPNGVSELVLSEATEYVMIDWEDESIEPIPMSFQTFLSAIEAETVEYRSPYLLLLEGEKVLKVEEVYVP